MLVENDSVYLMLDCFRLTTNWNCLKYFGINMKKTRKQYFTSDNFVSMIDLEWLWYTELNDRNAAEVNEQKL